MGEFAAACGIAINDEKASGTGEGELDRNGAGRATGSEEDDGFASWIDEGL